MAIQFHGQSLSATLVDSIPHVALKPICENIGLDWSAQLQKIKRHPVLNSVMVMITTTGNDGKLYEMLMLPIKYLNGWLFGIDASRIKPELKPRVLEYQRECFDVLANHFMPQLSGNSGQLQEPLTQKSLPGGLTLNQQDIIKKAVKQRAEELPKEHWGSASMKCWSSIKAKYGCSYKQIAPEHFFGILSLLARIDFDDEVLQIPKKEFEAIVHEKAKALPTPVQEGELLNKAQHLSVTLNLPPLADKKTKRFLVTQAMDEMLTLWPISSETMVGELNALLRELRTEGYVVFRKDDVSVSKLVMDFIPAQFLPVLIETAAQRLKAIHSA